MSKREVKTDLWVAGQLDKCGIQYTPQGSDVKEIGEALSSASKRGTGKTGFPEYVAVVNDFVIVIEDKADLGQHIKLTDSGILDTSTKAVTDFAVNGAYFYAKHIAQKNSFRKVFAIGVSGDSRHHKITPLYVDDRESYRHLLTLSPLPCLLSRTFKNTMFGTSWRRKQTLKRRQKKSSRMLRSYMNIYVHTDR